MTPILPKCRHGDASDGRRNVGVVGQPGALRLFGRQHRNGVKPHSLHHAGTEEEAGALRCFWQCRPKRHAEAGIARNSQSVSRKITSPCRGYLSPSATLGALGFPVAQHSVKELSREDTVHREFCERSEQICRWRNVCPVSRSECGDHQGRRCEVSSLPATGSEATQLVEGARQRARVNRMDAVEVVWWWSLAN